MYWCFACLYVFASCMCGAHRGQQRTLDPLELELQMVMQLLVTTVVVCEGVNLGRGHVLAR